jgi:pimeloyl-ACP methyl ester carboxylesterase
MLRTISRLALGLLGLILLLVCFVALRHVVYWAPTEDVAFRNGDVVLAGTMVKPASSGYFPVVVLLHGSGPESRGGPITRVVANTLVRNGYAVLMYDKRGVADSSGNFEEALYPDFVADAVAAVDYLTTRDDIDSDLIGIYAVSEGAWFAPEVAVRTQKVAFIFNKVGSTLPVEESWLWEIGNEFLSDGFSEADASKLVALAHLRWNYYQDAASDPSLATGPRRDAINMEIARVIAEVPNAHNFTPSELAAYDQEAHVRFAANSTYDPGPFVHELNIPMYFTYGELDPNIPTKQSVAELDALIESGKNIEYRVFSGVGHGLATWKGALELGYVPGYLDALDSWTDDRRENRQR